MTAVSTTLLSRLGQARRRIAHSIKLRMVVVFLLLAAAMTLVFVAGAQRAFSVGWREAARPLVMDYVDRLSADIAGNGTPSVARAQALVERLPLTVRISGPTVNWSSHPGQRTPNWLRDKPDAAIADADADLAPRIEEALGAGAPSAPIFPPDAPPEFIARLRACIFGQA